MEVSTVNPYEKIDLHPKSVELLEDINYQNIILPNEINGLFKNNQNVVIYFFSPICPSCLRITPIIIPMAQKWKLKYSCLIY